MIYILNMNFGHGNLLWFLKITFYALCHSSAASAEAVLIINPEENDGHYIQVPQMITFFIHN